MDVNQTMATMEADLRAFISRHGVEQKGIRTQLDQLRAEFLRPDGGRGSGASLKSGLEGFETPGARFIKEADLELFAKTGRLRCDLKHFWPAAERKTLIDSTALGFSTPGILGSTNIEPGITSLARRRLVVRQLMRAKPIETAQIDWIKELAYTNAASPQTEGSAKPESANTFVIASEKVRTLAHWVPITRQAMDDQPSLGDFINSNLLYGLSIIEENELLFGSGVGDHLHGLGISATAYAGTYDVAGDTKLDKLRRIICELEAANENCTGFVLSPIDTASIDLQKTEEGGANKGSYLAGDVLGGTVRVKTYWGVPVVSTNAMPAGRFLAGDFSMAIIGDRMGATVDLSTEHADYFTSNKVAIRCEERLSLACLRAGAFRYGSF